jgi:cobalamin biosynthesis Mg chelatase CobN
VGVGRTVSAIAAAITFGVMLGACGSGGSGTVSDEVRQAVSAKTADAATTATATATEPAKTSTITRTETQTASTVTKTRTASTPPQTTPQTTQSTKVLVAPSSTTGGEQSSKVPGWGWLLIGLGAAGIIAGIFWVGRRSGRKSEPPHTPPGGAPPPP